MTVPTASSHSLDPDAYRRADILSHLGPQVERLPVFDEIAADLGRKAEEPYAMVNLIGPAGQHFYGLYVAPGAAPISRDMPLDHGYCPEVMGLRLGRVLSDVCLHPRFRSNPVVDRLGVRTYAGAPVIVTPAGDRPLCLGTTCFIGPQQRPDALNHHSLGLVKTAGAAAADVIAAQAASLGLAATPGERLGP
jgi:hypothetical protein